MDNSRRNLSAAIGVIIFLLFIFLAGQSRAGSGDMIIYVSKLGDNSNGSSWAKAFHTIQAALDAIPDGRGGYRIIIRPDTYFEANLYPHFKGAKGRYNSLNGDFNGALGSGTAGQVIIDSGDPEQKGFKSYDWWSTFKATQQGWSKDHTEKTFSATGWDRWALRHLYVTGSDAGLFWDGTNRVEPFTVLVEDCTGIGRAFGGGVASVLSRPEEPVVFRRCVLWSLDWWGDTAGAYVRVENKSMPAVPDVRFEDCTLVGPQCSLKGGNYGFKTFTHVRLDRCALVTLNFSQPAGTPTDGIIQSVEDGKYLSVDLTDCTLMGYKVFGVRVHKGTEKDIQYTTAGAVQAYIQFQQDLPEGFHRLGHWPAEVFRTIIPPAPIRHTLLPEKKQLFLRDMTEVTPVNWKGRLCVMESHRPPHGGSVKDYYITLNDFETRKELARFARGYSLASAIVKNGKLYVFASRYEQNNWNDVTLFQSSDLKNWKEHVVIRQEADEHLFNSSVCAGPGGYIMAYESNDPDYPAFTVKFARSDNLEDWKKMPEALFGSNRYAACPVIRYVDGYYYLLYLEHRKPRHYFETYIARSADLKNWELSAANPVLRPEGLDEGINASDPDIIAWQGKTLLFYAVGDQLTWMNEKYNEYKMPLKDFFQWWFTSPGVPDAGKAKPEVH